MHQADKLILASKSPRRINLLREAGIDFEVIPSRIDESKFMQQDITPQDLARRLAWEKASAVARICPDRLVLGADTLIDCQGAVIGKPIDAIDAERIIRKLFSQNHYVITGMALVHCRKRLRIVTSDVTKIYPRLLSEADIRAHIQGGTWRGKAGAYAIQENGDKYIKRTEGSLSNVIGLPMEKLGQILADIL